MEGCFLSDLRASSSRFILVDQSGIEVRINCHLFTRHTIERETSGNLSDTSGTFDDNEKVYEDKDGKNDDSNNIVSTDHKLTKRLDHGPGSICPTFVLSALKEIFGFKFL